MRKMSSRRSLWRQRKTPAVKITIKEGVGLAVRVQVVPFRLKGSLHVQTPEVHDVLPEGPQGKQGAVSHSGQVCCASDQRAKAPREEGTGKSWRRLARMGLCWPHRFARTHAAHCGETVRQVGGSLLALDLNGADLEGTYRGD